MGLPKDTLKKLPRPKALLKECLLSRMLPGKGRPRAGWRGQPGLGAQRAVSGEGPAVLKSVHWLGREADGAAPGQERRRKEGTLTAVTGCGNRS